MKVACKFLVLFVIIYGCTPNGQVVLMNQFNGDGVVVINFSTQGSYIEPLIGVSAADLLTEALFLKSYIRVIDRSNVNDLLVEMELKSPEVISCEEIQALGKRLNANYLILGRIVQIDDREFLKPKDERKLHISFRIISTQDSNVIGMAAYDISYYEDIYGVLKKVMNEFASKVKL